MNLLKLYGRVLALLGPEAGLGWFLAVANLALSAAMFAEPVLFGRIIDALAGSQKADATPLTFERLLPLLGAWAGFGLFTILCGVFIALHADRLSHRRRQAVLTDYFEHVLQLPLAYHGGSHSGRLMKVMLTGTDSLWGLWLSFFRENLAALVSLIILLPLSLYLNWRLALLLIVLCTLFVVLTTFVLRKTGEMQASVEKYYSDLAERASDALGNVALVQSFARIEAEVMGLRMVVERLLGAQMPVLSWWAVMTVLTRASTTITLLAIFVLGTWLFFQGLTTIGEIVMFMSFATMLVGRLEQVAGFINSVFMVAPRLQEFFDVLDTVPAVRDAPHAIDPGRLTGRVNFEDVSFSYDGKRAAIADLSFTAQPGEVIALVGPTGAGKTTALALLHRVFDPQSGRITIDDIDLRDMKLAALRRNIGVVFQEVLLFNRSVRENLTAGKPDATDEEMIDALKRAQAYDFVERNPDKLNAIVGERGRFLSGGERQRLSIARALLKNPPILILDEATSALDAATEIKVQAALDEVMKDRTTFVIAHRLATIRNATRILVFKDGRVIETGSFDQLVAQGGAFAELARSQFLVAPEKKAESEDAAE
ncbi:glucan ABC transporter ATP-binding protein/ permease [Pseudorhodoplanes sp.]|uniref:glucan ABC transporter ATP-binding protein/ permease n=1 Tax=Pseudorhodoplanes sp. TaxID=1934341 RepID=UPI002C52ED9D|nr:glucan ABC transporter ATP-binding protein/ permease [Pseudorhodoplanes sp.]HWV40338.1 glucan ABC transporter ATP-binding protein/ permease [Pseudorhodoplanes sp.]